MPTRLKQISTPEPLTLTLSETSDKAEAAYLARQIRAFNDQVSPHHRAIRPVGPQPLNIFLHDQAGNLLGGLTASTYWGWLDIDNLWLAESLRGHGLGREILLAAEAAALARGCRRAKLTTFSFQAKDFYQKLGYQVAGQLDDYPPGSAYYWLCKTLGASTESPSPKAGFD